MALRRLGLVASRTFGPSEYGPVANFPKNQSGNVWSGNKRDTGQVINV